MNSSVWRSSASICKKKDDKSAFHEIESLVEEYPNDMRYQVVLGDVYMQNGKKAGSL